MAYTETRIVEQSFASLVDRPLPANFIVADALDPFDAPQPENNGHCRSKYTVQDASSTFVSSIKDTRHWQDMKNDPIFVAVHVNRGVIPLNVIVSTYRSSYEHEERDQGDLEEGEWTRDARSSTRHEEAQDVMDRLERSLSAEESAKAPAALPRTASWDHVQRDSPSNHSRPSGLEDMISPWALPQRLDSSSYGKRDRPIEDTMTTQWPTKIARLGRTAGRPCPPPPAMPESPNPSPERMSPLRSRTPSMFEL